MKIYVLRNIDKNTNIAYFCSNVTSGKAKTIAELSNVNEDHFIIQTVETMDEPAATFPSQFDR